MRATIYSPVSVLWPENCLSCVSYFSYPTIFISMQYFSYTDKREVLQHEYFQTLILPSPHFRCVVNNNFHSWISF